MYSVYIRDSRKWEWIQDCKSFESAITLCEKTMKVNAIQKMKIEHENTSWEITRKVVNKTEV